MGKIADICCALSGSVALGSAPDVSGVFFGGSIFGVAAVMLIGGAAALRGVELVGGR